MVNDPKNAPLQPAEQEFAMRIVRWLEEQDVSVSRIQREAFISKDSMHKYRKGTIVPHETTFRKLVDYAYSLGCPFVNDPCQREEGQ